MRTWIKLYTEIVSDPKMGRLSDHQYRTCINLFALAGIEDNDGALPNETDLAWHLRMSSDDLLKDLQALAKVGIVAQDGDQWLVTKWNDRQAKPPSAKRDAVRERVQRHRAKQDATGNDDVTTLHEKCNGIEEEEEVEVEEEQKKNGSDGFDPEFARAIRAFENDISLLSGTIMPDIADMWDLLTANGVADWWYTAIAIAVAANKRSWNYVRGILQNCLTEGKAPRLNGVNVTNGAAPKPKGKEKLIPIQMPNGEVKFRSEVGDES